MPNVKATQNVSCWLCEHFQRYDRDSEPVMCHGECRFRPPQGELDGVYTPDGQPDQDYLQALIWPAIEEAADKWCGRFQRTREQNLPTYPTACDQTTYKEAHDNFWIYGPWNKKILPGYVSSPEKGICCWNCDHFDPEEPTEKPSGYCRANPPWLWQILELGADTGWANSTHFIIPNGTCYWCSQWERATHDIIDPASWLCPYSPQE